MVPLTVPCHHPSLRTVSHVHSKTYKTPDLTKGQTEGKGEKRSFAFEDGPPGWFYSGTQFWPSNWDTLNVRQLNMNLHKQRTCHFILSNNHYWYNIAGLTEGNPLPSAIPHPLFSLRCKQEWETGSLSIHHLSIPLAAQLLAPSHWLLPPLTSLAFYLPLVSVRSGVRFRCCYLTTTEWACLPRALEQLQPNGLIHRSGKDPATFCPKIIH